MLFVRVTTQSVDGVLGCTHSGEAATMDRGSFNDDRTRFKTGKNGKTNGNGIKEGRNATCEFSSM